ncbi:MAG TPA: type II toxin-antitoxin system prevent-host-death family antitoxin [Candidatus Methylacidiphilales bacterium]|jgi:prevent-host-death family protein|nr:type II toxin-antitoxin system prevent-host-death family antitoxin [Candidatus Methylacidiphilales bacterium]
MKTATMRQLRNESRAVIGWVEAGEEVQITKRGKIIARLVPEKPQPQKVDWTKSAAFTMDRSKMRKISAKEMKALWDDLRGPY